MAYDYLVVGSGLFGSVFAHELRARGRRVLVVEQRPQVGGNVYTERRDGVTVHVYGPHIFHTSRQEVWEYVNRLLFFKPVCYSPIARYGDEVYSLPFSMYTFQALWGVRTPAEAAARLAEERAAYAEVVPGNLEEQALKLVGRTVYEKLIKGYTEKQWGRPCDELPPFIIRRLPVRLTYNNSYFNDTWQGIPCDGYTALIERLLDGVEVRTGVDFLAQRGEFSGMASKVLFTGRIDAYYDACFGALEYRSLRFETEVLPIENYQGTAVVNYTAGNVPYTRVTEHKHFLGEVSPATVVTHEYPMAWRSGAEPYYPVNDAHNDALYGRYAARAAAEPGVIFGGRLGMYRYYNMDEIVAQALELVQREVSG